MTVNSPMELLAAYGVSNMEELSERLGFEACIIVVTGAEVGIGLIDGDGYIVGRIFPFQAELLTDIATEMQEYDMEEEDATND